MEIWVSYAVQTTQQCGEDREDVIVMEEKHRLLVPILKGKWDI